MGDGLNIIILDLPEPPRQGGGRSKHWRGQWAKINKYKRDVWLAAIQQSDPLLTPPKAVRVALHYRLWARRDPSNLYADAKPLLDALKQRPATRDKLTWKMCVWLDRGYFVDDDHLVFGDVTQEVDRKNRGVTVTIEPIG